MNPIRIQLSRRKGWRMPANSEKVDRSSGWGNPYAITDKLSREESVALFRQWVEEHPDFIRKVKTHLVDKNLACWCPLDQPCHANVLLEIANPQPKGAK